MTDNQAKVVSLIDQYRTNPKASEKPADLPERAYKAYGVDAPQKRPTLIAIHYGNGPISLMQKSYLTEVLLTSHQHVSLVFTSCIITLEGQHLEQLLELLQDEKILSLHCFNSKLHDKPEEGEILITKIERRNLGEVLMKKEK